MLTPLKKIENPQYLHEEELNSALDAFERGKPLDAAYFFDEAAQSGSLKATDLLYLRKRYQLLKEPIAAEAQLLEETPADNAKPDDQFRMGICYLAGILPYPQSDDKAFEYLQRAAKQGDARAQHRLAWMYHEARAEPNQDKKSRDKKAVELYEQAAQQAFAAAQNSLAWIYQKGRAEPTLDQAARDEKAVVLYQKAADQGHARAQYNLAWMYKEGRAEPGLDQVSRDEKVVALYEKAAEQGLASAQNNLAWMYKEGRAEPGLDQVSRDEKVVALYEKAAQQGLVEAQNNLGLMYEKGRAELQLDQAARDKKAVEWYEKAADQGHAGAQYNLAWMYKEGRAEPALDQAARDKKAVECYEKAADQGHAGAQYNLAWMYKEGRAEPALDQAARDKKAVELYEQAAEQGSGRAQHNLGLMYTRGRAEPHLDKAVRDEKALALYEKAAQQGLAEAQKNLGWMYRKGRAEGFIEQTIKRINDESAKALAERLQKKYQPFPRVTVTAAIRFLEEALKNSVLDEEAFLTSFREAHKALSEKSFAMFSRVPKGEVLPFKTIIENARAKPSSNTAMAVIDIAKLEAAKFLKSEKKEAGAISVSVEEKTEEENLPSYAELFNKFPPPPTYDEVVAEDKAREANSHELNAPARSLIEGGVIQLLPDFLSDSEVVNEQKVDQENKADPAEEGLTQLLPDFLSDTDVVNEQGEDQENTVDPFAGFSFVDPVKENTPVKSPEDSKASGNSFSFFNISDHELESAADVYQAEAVADAMPEVPQGEIKMKLAEESEEPSEAFSVLAQ